MGDKYIYKISEIEELSVLDEETYIVVENVSDTGGYSGEVVIPKFLLKDLYEKYWS